MEPAYRKLSKEGLIMFDSMEDIPPTNGALLKLRREDIGLTQQQVADIAGISLRRYQRYEGDDIKISASSFKTGYSICYALGLDPQNFIYVDGRKRSEIWEEKET